MEGVLIKNDFNGNLIWVVLKSNVYLVDIRVLECCCMEFVV